ncbi:hypothetical protein C4J81_05435 [Deltaproteobacteria bacterium Smac51]|nr:hypothetical protein C4J81_05435 [Deltaproteobacteria bacterium Smac51]
MISIGGLTGCLSSRVAPPTSVILDPISSPVTSKTMAGYYYEGGDGYFQFFLRPQYQKQTVAFTAAEVAVPLQKSWFGDFVRPEWKYYEAGHFRLEGYLYKLIIYGYPGEFDAPYLNVQLTAYDPDGRPVDALILDIRYEFEDVEGFSDYTIDGRLITIRSYVGYRWDAEDGDAGTVKKPVFQLVRERTYEIDHGRFKLLTEEEHEISFINRSRVD